MQKGHTFNKTKGHDAVVNNCPQDNGSAASWSQCIVSLSFNELLIRPTISHSGVNYDLQESAAWVPLIWAEWVYILLKRAGYTLTQPISETLTLLTPDLLSGSWKLSLSATPAERKLYIWNIYSDTVWETVKSKMVVMYSALKSIALTIVTLSASWRLPWWTLRQAGT